jgi:hypothetical protein
MHTIVYGQREKYNKISGEISLPEYAIRMPNRASREFGKVGKFSLHHAHTFSLNNTHAHKTLIVISLLSNSHRVRVDFSREIQRRCIHANMLLHSYRFLFET